MPRTRPWSRRALAAVTTIVAVLGLISAAAPAGASTSAYHEPYRPQFHFTPGAELDERPERA